MNKIKEALEKPDKIKFIYKKSEEYKTFFSNGALGAITPRGDFEFNLFFEHRELPKEEVVDVEGNPLQHEDDNTIELIVIRDLKVGIIMTPQQAEILGNWLIGRVEEYKNKINENE